MTEILIGLLGLSVGLLSGIEYARRSVVQRLDEINRESGESKTQIEDLRIYVDAVNDSVKECHSMNIETLKIVNNSILQNSAVIEQNNILLNKILK